jgi:tyrosyl-tRNA synthetase
MKNELLQVLYERGFLYQSIHEEALNVLCSKGPVSFYWGCDATADSLHVGNLMGIMVARWFQDMHHRPILLVGGGTTAIGDPAYRTTGRTPMTSEHIQENIKGIQYSLEKSISFTGTHAAKLVNNADWLNHLSYIPFLREIGSHFSVHRMLGFEMLKTRLEGNLPLSFSELNYMVLQAYDFLHLYREEGCVLQLGGSDQWGNLVCGVDLIRRIEGAEVSALTWPLLTTANGAKMGKSAQGAVWLDERKTSPYAYWQFWRNSDDRDVFRFLKLYTQLPLSEITALEKAGTEALKDAKLKLADEATAFLHGRDVLPSIHHTVRHVFGDQQREIMLDDPLQLPSIELLTLDEKGILVLEALERLGFITSRREGRQKIREGAVRLEGNSVSDELMRLHAHDFQEKSVLQLSLGAKKHGLIRLT